MANIIRAKHEKEKLLHLFEHLILLGMFGTLPPTARENVMAHLSWMKSQPSDLISQFSLSTNEPEALTRLVIDISFPALVRSNETN